MKRDTPADHGSTTTGQLFVELAAHADASPTVEVAYVSNYSDNLVSLSGTVDDRSGASHCIIDTNSKMAVVFGADSPNRNDGDIVINGRYIGDFVSASVE